MEAIVLLGPPGSGKGTASERVRDEAGYIHVSTGDMLREAVKKGTPLGREAEAYMHRGELVPDDLMVRLVEERLSAGRGGERYMFDGFPRTVPQAELLEQAIARRGGRLTHVILLDCPRAVLIQRLTGRRICRKCGTNFHVTNVPPRKPGICDACGGELYQRPDDQEATIVNRLEVYNRQTESLVSRYQKQGLLTSVDSGASPERLAAEILALLNGGTSRGVSRG
jgi:adenylate kinase